MQIGATREREERRDVTPWYEASERDEVAYPSSGEKPRLTSDLYTPSWYRDGYWRIRYVHHQQQRMAASWITRLTVPYAG